MRSCFKWQKNVKLSYRCKKWRQFIFLCGPHKVDKCIYIKLNMQMNRGHVLRQQINNRLLWITAFTSQQLLQPLYNYFKVWSLSSVLYIAFYFFQWILPRNNKILPAKIGHYWYYSNSSCIAALKWCTLWKMQLMEVS